MKIICAALLPVLLICVGTSQGEIISISIPENSQNPFSRPDLDGVWAVDDPIDVNDGIGLIVNPGIVGGNQWQDFALHQNDFIQPSPLYVASHVPEPSSVTVTYEFNSPKIVGGVEIVQHVNGITKVEGLIGDEWGVSSLGCTFGPSGDVTSGFVVGSEAELQTFSFANTTISGTVFQLVIRKTSHPFAFASYRIFPLDENGDRIDVDCVPVDTDGDGIPDDEDACLDSIMGETVVIGECDSGVDNMLFEYGCTLSDLVQAIAEAASNHGQFVSGVAHLANDFRKAGIITNKDRSALVKCAASSG